MNITLETLMTELGCTKYPERWNNFYQWVNERGLTEETIPSDTGFTNEFLPQ